MSRLVCADFDEFEEALYGVQGRYVLRSRQQRDWRLRVVELNGVALMFGREGAGTVYSGVGLPGFFNIFLPLSRHECTVVDGHRSDRRLMGWMVPDAMFHIDASQPATWMTVAMSCERVLRWAKVHEDEFDLSILTRNLVNVAQMDIAPLVWLARRLLRIDRQAPEELHSPAAEHAARTELMDRADGQSVPHPAPACNAKPDTVFSPGSPADSAQGPGLAGVDQGGAGPHGGPVRRERRIGTHAAQCLQPLSRHESASLPDDAQAARDTHRHPSGEARGHDHRHLCAIRGMGFRPVRQPLNRPGFPGGSNL
ncbi:hypothetical protein [Azotobacter beijerinckii]|uniref:hypothetical protein n=1 Tax=Azotobacter beijerinckii TaxID=170623 RepID=UPI000A51CCB0|nr:hypothetical protein [Azotobacter beijerinckii]